MKSYAGTLSLVIFLSSCICAFLLPWNFLVAPFGILLVFAWIMAPGWKLKWDNIRNSPMVWIWVIFGVLYVTGYFWSANPTEALNSILVKLGVFIFPVVFAGMRFDELKTKRILQSFLSGLLLVGVFMLCRALYYSLVQDEERWSYQLFAEHIMHPSYLSLYYVVGIMICFHGILLRDVAREKKALAAGFVLLFSILIFMLASKTGIISLVIVFVFYIGYAIVRFRRYAVGAAALVALVLAFFVAMKAFPDMRGRLERMAEAITSNQPVDPKDAESNRVRLLIWQADMELIAEHPLTGVGTGDVQDELMNKYAERGMTGAHDKKLNAHNQFFQTGIALGLPGLILLTGIFLAGFTWSIRKRFGFGALLTILLLFNFIPESMLQVQAGTLFFGFFYSLVLFAADRKLLSPPNVR